MSYLMLLLSSGLGWAEVRGPSPCCDDDEAVAPSHRAHWTAFHLRVQLGYVPWLTSIEMWASFRKAIMRSL